MNIKLASGLFAIILAWFAATGAHAQDSAGIPLVRDFTLEATAAQTL